MQKGGIAAAHQHEATARTRVLEVFDRDDDSDPKRMKKMSKVHQHFRCPITLELMLDPVIAEDEHTYERCAINQWLKTHQTSPVNPGCRLKNGRFIVNRALQGAIAAAVELGEVDEISRANYISRKKDSDLEKAEELFIEGRILDSAKLGLRKAQTIMASNYFFGENSYEVDYEKCARWSRITAETGDVIGQCLFGCCLYEGKGIERNWVEAVKLYELASIPTKLRDEMHRYHVELAYRIGLICYMGGFGVMQDYEKANEMFQIGAEAGDSYSNFYLGQLAYLSHLGLKTTTDSTKSESASGIRESASEFRLNRSSKQLLLRGTSQKKATEVSELD